MNFEKILDEVYIQEKLPDFLASEYNLISCLKNGVNKSVYLVEDNKTNKKCILKCSEADYTALLRREYSILEKLKDVIKVPQPIFFEERHGRGYLMREYIAGETISDKVEKNKLSEDDAFEVVRKVCSVIGKLHSLKPPVILRDIKPENIIVSDNECIIIDFDTAREWDKNATSDTEYIGTKNTAAPEQFGYSQSDIRTDVYAVGKLMTYMMTGGYDVDQVQNSKAKRIIRKCTSFSPEKRYHSVNGVSKATKFNTVKFATAIMAVLAILIAAVFFLFERENYEMSPTNTYGFTRQAKTKNEKMVSEALDCIDLQSDTTVRGERSKREMINFMLKKSQYAVFGGENWPTLAATDEKYYIQFVSDVNLEKLDGTQTITLDTNSSASMSAGWYISGVVYTEEISLQSYRVYIDGEAGKYDCDTVAAFFRRNLQAAEHIRIDETRSMSFVSCNDEGFYFIEYGSDDNTDRHLRLRYYTFEEFTHYVNNLNKQMWYYEIDESLNPQ